jgi:hypothetical protein
MLVTEDGTRYPTLVSTEVGVGWQVADGSRLASSERLPWPTPHLQHGKCQGRVGHRLDVLCPSAQHRLPACRNDLRARVEAQPGAAQQCRSSLHVRQGLAPSNRCNGKHISKDASARCCQYVCWQHNRERCESAEVNCPRCKSFDMPLLITGLQQTHVGQLVLGGPCHSKACKTGHQPWRVPHQNGCSMQAKYKKEHSSLLVVHVGYLYRHSNQCLRSKLVQCGTSHTQACTLRIASYLQTRIECTWYLMP